MLVMKKINYKLLISLFLLFYFPVFASNNDSTENLLNSYIIKNGKLYQVKKSILPFKIDGYILQKQEYQNFIFYIKTRKFKDIIEDNNSSIETPSDLCFLGIIKKNELTPMFEKKIPINSNNYSIEKLRLSFDAAYLLIKSKQNSSKKIKKNFLYRFDLNKMKYQRIADIQDFEIINEKLAIIQTKNNANFFIYANNSIPITLTGHIKISRIIDFKIAILQTINSEIKIKNLDKEIIDFVSGKNIYTFNKKNSYSFPTNTNLIVKIKDNYNPNSKQDFPIFYKYNFDSKEEKQTETGSSFAEKKIMLFLEPNQYHTLQIERWKLGRRKKRYKRCNNIRQPKVIRFFVPQNRIIEIKIEFNNKVYKIKSSLEKN